jgi:hypothetical protein
MEGEALTKCMKQNGAIAQYRHRHMRAGFNLKSYEQAVCHSVAEERDSLFIVRFPHS